MSSTAPIISGSSSSPSHVMDDNRMYQYHLERFLNIPKDIIHDIIYCQRALKDHIKVHQMVLDVFQQQRDADPIQKKRILDELETDIFEINAEQSFIFIRLKRILNEFTSMLEESGIPTDMAISNNYISKLLTPMILNTRLEVIPTTVMIRNTEEKLIEKYFEVQKDTKPEPVYHSMEIINLDDEQDNVEEQTLHKPNAGSSRQGQRKDKLNAAVLTGESLLKAFSVQTGDEAAQPSLLKPFNQRMSYDLMTVNDKPDPDNPVKTLGDLYKRKREEQFINQKINQDVEMMDVEPKVFKPVKTLSDFYQQKKEEKDMELPVSTNVKMSRMNLRQALKRAQAAVRGPIIAGMPASVITTPPPPPPPSTSEFVVKKITKAKATRSAALITSGVKTNVKPIEKTSSSEEGTPERSPTPSHNCWPNEIEETRTKADEYGQEMFLRLFDLFTPEQHAQMQQRRSKRRRRCVQNSNYHYGRIENHPASSVIEGNKKKRNAFLLSPKIKKTAKRTKRRSADSASTSRSASSSPDMKRSCNECLKTDRNLEQCEDCKFFYHLQCHSEDDSMIADDAIKAIIDLKKCPGCKRNNDKTIKNEILHKKHLQLCADDLDLQYTKEKDRHEILQRTGKSYKIQMNNLYKIVNSLKIDALANVNKHSNTAQNDVIILD